MRSIFTVLLFLAFFLTPRVFAQTTVQSRSHLTANEVQTKNGKENIIVEKDDFNGDNVLNWTGTGPNYSFLVIDWNDNKSKPLVWGFRYLNATVYTMITAIAKADPRLLLLVQNNDSICGIGYSEKIRKDLKISFDLEDAQKNTSNPFKFKVPFQAPQTAVPADAAKDAADAIYEGLKTGIISHPFNKSIYGIPSADYTSWTNASTSGRWSSGNQWKYFVREEDENTDDYIYTEYPSADALNTDLDDDMLVYAGWNSNALPESFEMASIYYTVKSISLDTASLRLSTGGNATLKATILPDRATDKEVIWKSSDPTIASVQNGMITALKVGTATITATTEQGEFTASCAITVTEPVTGVILSKTKLSLFTDDIVQLKATILPEHDGVDQATTWSSSNTSVADVDTIGKVLALSAGTTIIKVTTKEGAFTAECEVNVTTRIHATDIELNQEEQTLYEGEKFALKATITPAEASNKNIFWATTNAQIATVNNGEVTAVRAGTAKIIAFTEDGNYSARCTLTILKPKPAVTDNNDKLDLTFSRTYEAAWYAISVYKYLHGVPVLYTIYKIDAEGKVLSGKASLKSTDYYKVNLLTDRWDAGDYIVTATSYESSDESKLLNTASTDKLTISIATANQLINAGEADIYYVQRMLHLMNLEGYHGYVSNMKGNMISSFNISSADEQHYISLPTGIYVVTAIKDTHRIVKKIAINQ